MSILIKGMEMPEKCGECLFGFIGVCSKLTECQLTDDIVDEESKPGWCPLVKIPPHGRLIDADVLCEDLFERWNTADKNAEKVISAVMADVVTPIVVGAPTVIEAEGRA